MEPCNGEVVKIVADEFHYVFFVVTNLQQKELLEQSSR